MELHLQLVYYAKAYGLVYLVVLSLLILLYTYWPSNKIKFDNAADQILEGEDRPCQ